MSNQEQRKHLAELANSCHQIERNIDDYARNGISGHLYFHYRRALEHAEHARMYAGDLLRLAVLGGAHRNTDFFDVAKHGGRYTGELCNFETTVEFIKWAKRELRALFYILSDMDADIEGTWIDVPAGVNRSEWRLYGCQLMIHIKEADQCLGLWLGAILESKPLKP